MLVFHQLIGLWALCKQRAPSCQASHANKQLMAVGCITASLQWPVSSVTPRQHRHRVTWKRLVHSVFVQKHPDFIYSSLWWSSYVNCWDKSSHGLTHSLNVVKIISQKKGNLYSKIKIKIWPQKGFVFIHDFSHRCLTAWCNYWKVRFVKKSLKL